MKRRAVLCAACAPLVSGCANRRGSNSSVEISEIKLQNLREERATIGVLAIVDDELRYHTVRDIDPATSTDGIVHAETTLLALPQLVGKDIEIISIGPGSARFETSDWGLKSQAIRIEVEVERAGGLTIEFAHTE